MIIQLKNQNRRLLDMESYKKINFKKFEKISIIKRY